MAVNPANAPGTLKIADLLANLDVDGDGDIDEEDMELAKTIRAMDIDGDGTITLRELVKIGQTKMADEKKIKNLWRLVGLVVIAALLFCGVMVGLMVLANEASKDSRPSATGNLKTIDGKSVKTDSIATKGSIADLALVDVEALKTLKNLAVKVDKTVGDKSYEATEYYTITGFTHMAEKNFLALHTARGDTILVDNGLVVVLGKDGVQLPIKASKRRARSLLATADEEEEERSRAGAELTTGDTIPFKTMPEDYGEAQMDSNYYMQFMSSYMPAPYPGDSDESDFVPPLHFSDSEGSDSDSPPACLVENCDANDMEPMYTMDIDEARRMRMMDTMVCPFVRPIYNSGCHENCRGTHDEEMVMDVMRACNLTRGSREGLLGRSSDGRDAQSESDRHDSDHHDSDRHDSVHHDSDRHDSVHHDSDHHDSDRHRSDSDRHDQHRSESDSDHPALRCHMNRAVGEAVCEHEKMHNEAMCSQNSCCHFDQQRCWFNLREGDHMDSNSDPNSDSNSDSNSDASDSNSDSNNDSNNGHYVPCHMNRADGEAMCENEVMHNAVMCSTYPGCCHFDQDSGRCWFNNDGDSEGSDVSDSDEVPECMVNHCATTLVEPFYTMDIDAAHSMGMMDTMVCPFVQLLVEDGCIEHCRGTHDEEMVMDVMRACGLLESDSNRDFSDSDSDSA